MEYSNASAKGGVAVLRPANASAKGGVAELRPAKGFVLIVFMWVLVILGIIAGTVVFSVRLELKKAGYALDRVRALYAANGAAEKVRANLNRDRNSYDALNEPWIINPGDYEFTYEDVSYKVTVTDEERKINLNNSETALVRNSLALNGAANFQEITDSLLDWKDPGTEKHKLGAKDEYYLSLKPPYPCKKAPLDTVEELLLIKGVPEAVYSSCAGYFTVYGGGRININTAESNVLAVLPGITSDEVKAMLSTRRGLDGLDGTRDDRPFTSIDDALSRLDSKAASRIAEFIGVSSNNFRVKISASAGRAQKNIECIMLKRPFTVDIISWKEIN